ncbi:MAG: hypothetical protein EOP21_01900 [Hyphomicrobiales bacterium]|nr:MAG: hypothetical protein EOP21_01900 [Hyphomicrobiales bacterium]
MGSALVTGLNAAALFIFFIAVMGARRPDIINNPQLWAEDGAVWFAPAFNGEAFELLFRPHAGYLNTFSRLVFGAATLLPIEMVPLFANLVGLAVRAGLVLFFISPVRFSWVDWREKTVLVAYFLLMPNIQEVHANITNTHWYLGLYLLALVLADRPATAAWKIHDLIVLVVAGLSGPFVIFAAPCFIVRDVATGGPKAISIQTWLAVILAIIELSFVLTGMGSRPTVVSEATFEMFLTLVAVRVFASAFASYSSLALVDAPLMWLCWVPALAAAVIVAVRGGWRGWCLMLFPALLIAATLASPLAPWATLMAAGRYFVAPIVCWIAVLCYAAGLVAPWLKTLYPSILLAMVVSLSGAFRMDTVGGASFKDSLAPYYAAAPGTPAKVAVTPEGWMMTLVRRQ